jgi:HEAT repeat protein
MRPTQHRLGVRLALLPLLAVLSAPVRAEEEPRYEGKPLRHYLGLLKGRDPEVDAVADLPVWDLHRVGRPAVPALVAALRDQDPLTRHFAASGLEKLRSEAREAVPALLSARKDPDAPVRLQVLRALARIAPEMPEVVPALVEILQTAGEADQAEAARLLGRLGDRGRAALPALAKAAQSPQREVRPAVAAALVRIARDQEALALLMREGADSSPVYRLPAVQALGDAGPAALAAVPLLIRCLRVPDPPPLPGLGLGGLGGRARPGGGGPGQDRASRPCRRPGLTERLQRDDESVTFAAAVALVQTGGDRRRGLDFLLTHRDPPWHEGVLAAEALGQLGPEAKEAVPALLDLLYDPHAGEAAIMALRGIDPEALRRELVP